MWKLNSYFFKYANSQLSKWRENLIVVGSLIDLDVTWAVLNYICLYNKQFYKYLKISYLWFIFVLYIQT